MVMTEDLQVRRWVKTKLLAERGIGAPFGPQFAILYKEALNGLSQAGLVPSNRDPVEYRVTRLFRAGEYSYDCEGYIREFKTAPKMEDQVAAAVTVSIPVVRQDTVHG